MNLRMRQSRRGVGGLLGTSRGAIGVDETVDPSLDGGKAPSVVDCPKVRCQ